jgi:hypothetical protein
MYLNQSYAYLYLSQWKAISLSFVYAYLFRQQVLAGHLCAQLDIVVHADTLTKQLGVHQHLFETCKSTKSHTAVKLIDKVQHTPLSLLTQVMSRILKCAACVYVTGTTCMPCS